VAFENSILLNQLQIPSCAAACMAGCAVRGQCKAS